MKDTNHWKSQTCCFTGHRDIPAEKIPALRKNLQKIILSAIEEGYLYFGAGGALGFDTIAAQTVLELKKTRPEIKLILVLPCKNQDRFWNKKDVYEYEKILKTADKVTYTSEHYFAGCMQKRNRRLVDFSSLCICYLNKSTGGTAYTANYAKRMGLKIINAAKV